MGMGWAFWKGGWCNFQPIRKPAPLHESHSPYPELTSHTLVTKGIPLVDSDEESFHLWFTFRGRQHVRVGAESATFRLEYISEGI